MQKYDQYQFWITFVCSLFMIGCIGAKISKEIQLGNISSYWYIFVSIMSGLVWAWLTKYSANLIQASMVYDVLYALSFVVAFKLLGEPVTTVQTIGIVICLIGLAFVSS